MKTWTIKDVGCYADGSFGQKHGREILAGLLKEFANFGNMALINELLDDNTDDPQSAIDEALDLLNDHVKKSDNIVFTFVDGDLMLIEESQLSY